MIAAVVGLTVGLVVLAYSADQFVIGAARLAVALRISTIVIGAVVIGFGTSAPELLVSGLAAAQGAGDLAIGNVVGSNVANLTLVLGTTALITPVLVRTRVLRREAPLSFGVTALFAAVAVNGIGPVAGGVLTLAFVAALGLILWGARNGDSELGTEVSAYVATAYPATRRETLRTVIGLAGTVLAARILVDSARFLAAEFGIAEGFVGLTIVAIGTSLPELATAVQAARKGETDLIVGNLLGSNLFNAGAVGALVGFLGPDVLDDPTVMIRAIALMIVVSLIAMAFLVTRGRVGRVEGGLLLVGYLVALPLLGR